jgi:large subunit ribosomal protein L15
MRLDEITQVAGAHKRRRRVGRGESSGLGKTAGKGHKGALARSGVDIHPLSEGGQMPLFRRLPKRGFNNANFRKTYQPVNLQDLERRFDDGATVDLAALVERGVVNGRRPLVKVLAKGTLSKKLTVHAHAFSDKAKAAIEQSGGSATLIPQVDRAAAWKAKRRTVVKAKAAMAASAPEATPTNPPPAETEAGEPTSE